MSPLSQAAHHAPLPVEVSDDGCHAAAAERGTRLSGLNDQLTAIDGRLDVDSAPGRGTTVRVSLPRYPS